MTAILNIRYPFLDESYKKALLKSGIVASFVFLFLWLFNNLDQQPFYKFIEYSAIIFLCQFLFLFSLPKVVLRSHKLSEVKIWQYSIALVLFILSGYVFTFLYDFLYMNCSPSWRGLFSYIGQELPTCIPIFFVVISIDYIFVLRKELNTTRDLNILFDTKQREVHVSNIIPEPQTILQESIVVEEPEIFLTVKESIESEPNEKPLSIIEEIHTTFVFTDEAGKEALKTNKKSVLYLKAADNYIEVFFLNEKKVVRKELIRNKLSSVETNPENDFLDRVHRSYLCNLINVSHISGNSKGYLLHFSESEATIPVSRSKSELVVEKLNKMLKK